jgi:hypothetical protein
MVKVIERSGGRYEVQEVEFGRVYRWCPECVVIECDCGEMTILTPSGATCRCGADHIALIRGELDRRLGDEELHPWRYAKEREGAGLPF